MVRTLMLYLVYGVVTTVTTTSGAKLTPCHFILPKHITTLIKVQDLPNSTPPRSHNFSAQVVSIRHAM